MLSTERRSRPETRKGGTGQGNRTLTLPKISALPIILDTTEHRRVQCWALNLLREAEDHRYRQRRREEYSTAPTSAAPDRILSTHFFRAGEVQHG